MKLSQFKNKPLGLREVQWEQFTPLSDAIHLARIKEAIAKAKELSMTQDELNEAYAVKAP